MKLTLSAAGGPLAEIDLGQPEVMGPRDTFAYLESGDLGGTSGNLYLTVDGTEHGALFFHVDREGRLVIELGRFNDDTGDWEPGNPLLAPMVDTDAEAPTGGIEHGPVPATWFTPGVWPTCACGLAPHDNGVLTAHWREHGFEVVDAHGTLRTIQLGETTHAGSHS